MNQTKCAGRFYRFFCVRIFASSNATNAEPYKKPKITKHTTGTNATIESERTPHSRIHIQTHTYHHHHHHSFKNAKLTERLRTNPIKVYTWMLVVRTHIDCNLCVYALCQRLKRQAKLNEPSGREYAQFAQHTHTYARLHSTHTFIYIYRCV